MIDMQKKIENLIDLYKQKKYSEVEYVVKSLLKENPEVGILYNILGLTFSDQNKRNEAIEIFKEGIKKSPKFAILYNNLANIYKQQNKLKEAEKLYRKSIEIEPKIIEAYNNLGNLLRKLNKYKEAIENYKKSIQVKDNNFYVHFNLGVAYKSIGKFSEATESLTRAVKLNPYFGEAHKSLAGLKKYEEKDNHLIEMRNIYQSKKINKVQKTNLAFALGKAHEDIKDYKSAFEYFKDGNKSHRLTFEYSTKDTEIEIQKIKKTYNTKLFDKFKNVGNKDTRCIFILGMPRSGTTLVEQIVSSHSMVHGGDELNIIPDLIKKISISKDINEKYFKDLGDFYLSEINNMFKIDKKITDKMPINFLWIGLIKLILPNSKILHCTRNSYDTCFSIYKNHFSSNIKFAYDLNEIKIYYKLYKDLMNYWKTLFSDFIIDINYEDIINNSSENIKSLIKKCDLEWDENCLSFYNNNRPIKTASDTQARKKIYNTSLGLSKNYENQLNDFFYDLDE